LEFQKYDVKEKKKEKKERKNEQTKTNKVACVSSLTPLYSTQLCEFLCVPDGGEHLGN